MKTICHKQAGTWVRDPAVVFPILHGESGEARERWGRVVSPTHILGGGMSFFFFVFPWERKERGLYTLYLALDFLREIRKTRSFRMDMHCRDTKSSSYKLS